MTIFENENASIVVLTFSELMISFGMFRPFANETKPNLTCSRYMFEGLSEITALKKR